MPQILDGKMVSNKICNDLKNSIIQIVLKGNRAPKLSIIQVGDNGASNLYIKNKIKKCEEIGILSEHIKLDNNIEEQKLIKIIDNLNSDVNCDGIIVQLPLPKHINENKVIKKISPAKDADGFSAQTIGSMFVNDTHILPATPKGIMLLLKEYEINLLGKNVVIVGRSNIVGKPLAVLMINKSATVTVCNSKTTKLNEICQRADILITAVGVAGMFDENYVKDGAIVIDVGTNKKDNKFVGDCNFSKIWEKVSMITPVPGGVGPMTIAALLDNVFQMYKEKMEK